MIVILNGSSIELPEDTTLLDMLEQKGIDEATVVVQVNLDIILRDRFNKTFLHHGDTVEVLRFVGGG